MTSDTTVVKRRKPLTAWFVLATLILLVGYIWVENHYMQDSQPSIAEVQKKLNQLKLYVLQPFGSQKLFRMNFLQKSLKILFLIQ